MFAYYFLIICEIVKVDLNLFLLVLKYTILFDIFLRFAIFFIVRSRYHSRNKYPRLLHLFNLFLSVTLSTELYF